MCLAGMIGNDAWRLNYCGAVKFDNLKKKNKRVDHVKCCNLILVATKFQYVVFAVKNGSIATHVYEVSI
jgi:hypothetical protein